MKLAYIYFGEHPGFELPQHKVLFKHKAFQFHPHLLFHFDPLTQVLTIQEAPKLPQNFFGDERLWISAVVGENGAGKTTLLRNLGKDRNSDIRKGTEISELFVFSDLEGKQMIYSSWNDIKVVNPNQIEIEIIKVDGNQPESKGWKWVNWVISIRDGVFLPRLKGLGKSKIIYLSLNEEREIPKNGTKIDNDPHNANKSAIEFLKQTASYQNFRDATFLLTHFGFRLPFEKPKMLVYHLSDPINVNLVQMIRSPEIGWDFNRKEDLIGKTMGLFDTLQRKANSQIGIPEGSFINKVELIYFKLLNFLVRSYSYFFLEIASGKKDGTLYEHFSRWVDLIEDKLVSIPFAEGDLFEITEKILIDFKQHDDSLSTKEEMQKRPYTRNPFGKLTSSFDGFSSFSISLEYLMEILKSCVGNPGFFEINLRQIEVVLNDANTESLCKFIDNLKEFEELTKVGYLEYLGLSSGEMNFLNIFSAIAKFDKSELWKENSQSQTLEDPFGGSFVEFQMVFDDLADNCDQLILLLDECDIALHPEWQRNYVNWLVEFCRYNFQYASSIQIILATHSPIILSDLPKHVVNYLLSESQKSKPSKQTFAANIHTLLADSFFLESTIGEFAKGKVDDLIKYLKTPASEKPQTQIQSDEEAQSMIDLIGEPILARELQRMLNQRQGEHTTQKVSDLEEKVKHLEEEVERLKKGGKDADLA